MAAPDKLNQVIGYLAKIEAVYGVAETLSNTLDACNPYIGDGDPEPPTPIDYAFNGALGRAAGVLSPQRGTTPNGRSRASEFKCLPKGAGSAYSASVFPPNEIDRHLLAAGYDRTFSATPTPQHLYTPTAAGTTFGSLTVRQYMQGSQFDHVGVLCDFAWEATGLGAPVFSFPWRGLLPALPSDTALPALTLQATGVIPPVASAVVGNLGAFSAAEIRKSSFKRNRNTDTARVAQNTAGGHNGFIPGGFVPEWELTIARPNRATWDPESVMAAATVFPFDVQFGLIQYNRWKHGAANSQLVKVVPGNEGALATVTLTIRGVASSPTANDAEYLLWN